VLSFRWNNCFGDTAVDVLCLQRRPSCLKKWEAASRHISVLLAVYELKGVGPDGTKKYFIKPWTMVTVMFLGMSLSLPLAYLEQWREEKKAKAEGATPLLEKVHKSSTLCPRFSVLLVHLMVQRSRRKERRLKQRKANDASPRLGKIVKMFYCTSGCFQSLLGPKDGQCYTEFLAQAINPLGIHQTYTSLV
jgi:hypothetical protein